VCGHAGIAETILVRRRRRRRRREAEGTLDK
jgi:hypothetical protein